MSELQLAILLLVLLQLKHFICDYPLQGQYMLGKARATDWFRPLLAHSTVHAFGTFLVFAYFSVTLAVLLAIVDLVLHFIVDRIKASPTMGGRWSPTQPYFWWALGLDQMAHHVVNIVFVYCVVVIVT